MDEGRESERERERKRERVRERERERERVRERESEREREREKGMVIEVQRNRVDYFFVNVIKYLESAVRLSRKH